MRKHIYRCPFGVTILLADNAKSLRNKIVTHNIIAHGVGAILVCGAVPMRQEPLPWDVNSATSPRRHATTFSLSGRGI